MDFFNNAKRNRFLSSVVYIILALCVVTIMCIAIFTVSNTGNNKATPESGQVPVIPEMTTNTQKAVTEPTETTALPPAVESGQVNNPLQEIISEDDLIEPTFDPSIPVESLDEIETDQTQDVVEIITEEPEPVSTGPQEFILPVHGYITKGHDDDLLVYSLTMNDYRIHQGIDIGSSVGAPVFASSSGTIESIYDDPFMGTTIVIDHGNGVKSHYKNLSVDLPQGIEEGVYVQGGQTIAGVGETSLTEMADTIHLHFEMTKDGININPLEYIGYDTDESEQTLSYYEY